MPKWAYIVTIIDKRGDRYTSNGRIRHPSRDEDVVAQDTFQVALERAEAEGIDPKKLTIGLSLIDEDDEE